MSYSPHSFYIPVMGVSFTIDTPVKVAKYGISSVIPLADDKLIEQMRQFYCTKYNFHYEPISDKEFDGRAKRITSYLNLINKIVEIQINELKESIGDPKLLASSYFDLLPEGNSLKIKYHEMLGCSDNRQKKLLQKELKEQIIPGRIDVNIMTKVDGIPENKNNVTFIGDGNAHSALRGFANSDIKSAVILSAGLNPKLYSYLENFDDFYPGKDGLIKKEIALKVSDFRSAQIQGNFLAKKGLWISEFRIESGLNCGGHAFATDGYLMGPILEEFKNKKEQLREELNKIYTDALIKKEKTLPSEMLDFRIGAQGGIGTANENTFLLNYYNLDATGWGSPFLLVPEVTTVDEVTLQKLVLAKKEDYYLSDVSPLGVLINNLRGNEKDEEKINLSKRGKPGSPCIKHYLKFNTEFTEKPICTASKKYQNLKIEQIKHSNLSQENIEKEIQKICNKVCLCEGLVASATLINNLPYKGFSKKVFICPGPNLAYFSRVFSLDEMVKHIYGQLNILNKENRSNMFINELKMYVDYYFDKVLSGENVLNTKRISAFSTNLLNGIDYYKGLVLKMKNETRQYKEAMMEELFAFEGKLKAIQLNLH